MSWAETIIALNRSLGTSTFAPLDEQIQEASLPAGFGSFDKTIFERSSADYSVTITDTVASKAYVLGKFIIPEDGMYKISFDYKLYNTGNQPSSYYSGNIELRNSISSTDTIGIRRVIDSKWYFDTSIGDGFYTTGGYGVSYLMRDIYSTEWKNVVNYFYLEKGTPSVLQGGYNNMSKNTTLFFMFRNVKVTY